MGNTNSEVIILYTSAMDPLLQLAQSSNYIAVDLTKKGFGKIATGNLSEMMSGAFDMAIAAGTALAVLRIVYAGWLYMGWADAAGEKSKGKEVFTDAIIGLIILYGIWLILNQINPCLTQIRILESSTNGDCRSASYTNTPQPVSARSGQEAGLEYPYQNSYGGYTGTDDSTPSNTQMGFE